MAAPLDGVRVLDASNFISGPWAGTILADLGAEVIKVEPKNGDAMRRWGRDMSGRGIVYTNLNRGKTVVSLDLKSDDGPARFLELAADADVLVTNWRNGVADRLGLTEPLAGHHSLIWVQITGWGSDGPLAGQPAFDGSIQSRSGLAWAQGDDEPQLIRSFIADKVTAMFAVQSITARLYERTSTGRGGIVELPMLDALSYFNFPDMMQNRTVMADQPLSQRNEQIEANRPIPTADGWILISPVGGRQLKGALEAIGRPEAVEELRAISAQHELIQRLVEICSEVCRERPTAQWLAIFDRHDVPAAPILDIDGHVADPQVTHNEIYGVVRDPVLGDVRRARYPARHAGDGKRGSDTALREVEADQVSWRSDRPSRGSSFSGARPRERTHQ